MVNQKITDEQAREIEKLYTEGYSAVMLARKFCVSHHTIRRWVRRHGTNIRTAKEAGELASLKGRLFGQHKIPDNSKIITVEKAYILGVMCGDGYLHKAKHSYQIGLQAVDKDFVLKFSRCMESVYKIKSSLALRPSRDKNWKPQWQARICSKAIYNDISEYNTFRTYTWTIPAELSKLSTEIKSKFLLGFFDSEGHVEIERKRLNAVSVNLHGLNQIKGLLKSVGIRSTIKINKEKRQNRKTFHSVNIQDRKSIELFFKLIGFSIERKQKRLKNMISEYKFYKHAKEELEEVSPTIKQLRSEGLSYGEISRRLKLSTLTVWRLTKN